MTILIAILYVWFSALNVAPWSATEMKLGWDVDQKQGLQYFFVYRQTPQGWIYLGQRDAFPGDPTKTHWRFIDGGLQCGNAYTYLVRAQGIQNGQTYLEDYRVDNTLLPCMKGKNDGKQNKVSP